jgi:choline dehydrogenase
VDRATIVRMSIELSAEIVVVGGGSSGAAMAGRLVVAGRDVVLVEAGPDYGALADGRWPAELIDARMLATTHDWGYAAGRWSFERARVIGGCSAHNGAIAAVGHRTDYDAWDLPGWSGADVAPVFDRVVERMRVRAYRQHEIVPFHAQCLDAAEALGTPIASDLCDLDAGDSFGPETVNVVGTTRWNSAFAYLDPVRHATNLRIVDHVLVDHVADGRSHATVHGTRNGETVTVRADTVVLAAGVYGSPAILQRSGYGDPAHLRSLGIDPHADLPGVGANLHDHPMFHADRAVGEQLQRWLDDVAATGFLPEEQTLGKFTTPHSPDGRYDVHVFPVIGSNQTSALHGRATVEVAVLDPLSRGSVRIADRDPAVAPVIDHRYLSDPDGRDLHTLLAGLTIAKALLDHPLVAPLVGEPVTTLTTPDEVHYYHPVGTCAMGPADDRSAVCAADGRLHGADRIVVADASVIPTIPRANTNLPAIMVAEHLADLLIGATAP